MDKKIKTIDDLKLSISTTVELLSNHQNIIENVNPDYLDSLIHLFDDVNDLITAYDASIVSIIDDFNNQKYKANLLQNSVDNYWIKDRIENSDINEELCKKLCRNFYNILLENDTISGKSEASEFANEVASEFDKLKRLKKKQSFLSSIIKKNKSIERSNNE